MYKVILKSYDFLEEFAKEEIKTILKQEYNHIDNETFELSYKDQKEFYESVYNILYFGRCFDGIYLRQNDKDDYHQLEKVEIDVGERAEIVYDLIGDILLERDYKVNEDDNYLSHFLVNFALYKLGIDKIEENFSLIDPLAELGDIIIETSLFNKRKPLYVKERTTLPIYNEFKIMPPLPKPVKDKNKFQALVLEDVQYKHLRENVNASGQKIKISKYDLDWLDVKFKKNDMDFAMTFLPEFEDEEESDEFLKEFFYQCEFICKKRICLISMEDIDLKYAKKYKLKTISKDEIEVDEEDFIVYIFEREE